MKLNQQIVLKPPLQVADFICRRCRVQATRNDDHICGICKAIGMRVEPETRASRQEKNLVVMLATSIIEWLEGHHLIVLNEAAVTIVQREK